MSRDVFMGNKKHGCYIDGNAHIIEYYELLSFYEKLKKRDNKTRLRFEEIKQAEVTYCYFGGSRIGTIAIHLTITSYDLQTYNFQILYFNDTREKFETFIHILQESRIQIIDPFHIFDTILHSNEKIGTIIDQINRERKKAN